MAQKSGRNTLELNIFSCGFGILEKHLNSYLYQKQIYYLHFRYIPCVVFNVKMRQVVYLLKKIIVEQKIYYIQSIRGLNALILADNRLCKNKQKKFYNMYSNCRKQ